MGFDLQINGALVIREHPEELDCGKLETSAKLRLVSPGKRLFPIIVCASVAEREWSFEGRLWFMNRVGLYNEILGHGLRLQP